MSSRKFSLEAYFLIKARSETPNLPIQLGRTLLYDKPKQDLARMTKQYRHMGDPWSLPDQTGIGGYTRRGIFDR